VDLGCRRLGTDYKASADPDSLGAVHQSSGQTSAVVNSTGVNDIYGPAGERARLALDEVVGTRIEKGMPPV